MALSDFTPEEIAEMKAKGINPEFATPIQPSSNTPTQAQTVGRTLSAHKGSILGGGVGTIGALALGGALAPETFGASLLLPLVVGTGGAIAGGYGGQKLQQTIESPEAYQQEQELAAQAAQAHPITAGITDVAASALASGALPSPTTAVKGIAGIGRGLIGQGLSNEAKNVLLQSAINPAIATGLSLAQGQGVPSGTELLEQAAGGALFGKSWLPHGRGINIPEEVQPLTDNGTTPETPATIETPFISKDETGSYKIGDNSIRNIFLKRNLPRIPKEADEITKAYIRTQNERIKALPIGQMRQTLHEQELANMEKLGKINSESGLSETESTEGVTTPIDELIKGGESEATPTTPEPEKEGPIIAPEILREVIDKGATKPVSVQRIFPNLNLSDSEAQIILDRANKLAETSLNHGDEVHAIMPDGTEVKGHVIGVEPTTGNPQIITEDKKVVTLPEKESNQNANTQQSPVETVRSQTPGPTPQVAEGEPSGLQTPARLSAAEEAELRGQTLNSPLSDYNRYVELQKQLEGMGYEKMGTPEFNSVWQESEAIKNRHGGMPPPKYPENHILMPLTIQQHIINNQATTGSILHALSTTAGHPYQTLAKHIYDLADTKGLNVPWLHDASLDTPGNSRTHYAFTDQVNTGTGSAGDARVVMEEAIHSIVAPKIPTFSGEGAEYFNRLSTYLKNGKNSAVKDIIRSYLDVAKQLNVHEQLFKDTPDGERGTAGNPDATQRTLASSVGDNDTAYAMGNLDEFIAQAIKSPSFQRTLENLKSSSTPSKTIMQKLVDAIREILGLSPKDGSMLDEVLRTSGELITQNRPGVEKSFSISERPPINKPPQKESIDKELKPPTKEEITSDKSKSAFLPFLSSRIDKIADTIHTPIGKYVTDKLHSFMGDMDYMIGKIGNRLINQTRSLSPLQVEKVYKYLYDKDNSGTSHIRLSPEEQTVADSITKVIREPRQEQIKLGLKVRAGDKFRTAGIKEGGYMFNMLDPKVAYEWTNNPSSPASKAFEKAYIDHQISHGATPQEALETFHDYIHALSGQQDPSVQFGAIRKAEGKGLPWELVDKNFANAARRYGERAARDLSFYKHIESDPKMRAYLGIADQFGNRTISKDYIGNNDVVKKAMRSIYGVDIPRNPALMTAARAISNTVMGVGTAARNILNMPSFVAQYVQLRQMPLVAKTIADYNSAASRAFESNAVRSTFKDLDAAGNFEGSPNPVVRLFDKYSAFMRKYSGRDFSDHFEGQFYYALGEKLATSNLALAKVGNKEAIHFLNRFGDIVEGGWKKLLYKEPTQEDVSRIAKRFVDGARGSYTAEGLPSWSIEGELAPFTALSRFSIEKSNTIWKDVVLPMKQGIYGPALRYTLASLGVGIGIEQLNQLLSNKRGPDATINEAIASGSQEALMSKAIGLLQMASFAGIVGDSAKAAMSAWENKGLQYNSPLSFPLYSLMTDTLATNIADATEAMKHGDDPFEVLGKLATTIATQSVQTMRYLDANFVHPDETKKKELFRDYRVFEQLQGKPVEAPSSSNPFLDIEAKKYKRTGDIGEAVSLLPGLIKKAIVDSKGDPFELKKKLSALKSNSYNTMPSIEQSPLAFMRYVNYLKQTQGEDAATSRVMDYLKQNQVNRVKGSLVP